MVSEGKRASLDRQGNEQKNITVWPSWQCNTGSPKGVRSTTCYQEKEAHRKGKKTRDDERKTRTTEKRTKEGSEFRQALQPRETHAIVKDKRSPDFETNMPRCRWCPKCSDASKRKTRVDQPCEADFVFLVGEPARQRQSSAR